MRHVPKHQVRTHRPHQVQDFQYRIPDPFRVEAMDDHVGPEFRCTWRIHADQSNMNLKSLAIKMFGKKGSDLFGSAAAQMGYQQ